MNNGYDSTRIAHDYIMAGNKQIYYNTIATTDQIPTKTSQLTNDSSFITSDALTGYATEAWVGQQGYQTASDVSSALTDYLKTNTFKKIEWIYNDSGANSSEHKLMIQAGDLLGYNLSISQASSQSDYSLTATEQGITARSRAIHTQLSSSGIYIGAAGSSNNSVRFNDAGLIIGNDPVINYRDIATKSYVSTAISGQTKETWTFTLADGSTVTKSVALG